VAAEDEGADQEREQDLDLLHGLHVARQRHRVYWPAMPTAPSKKLERVPNPHPDRDYEVDLVVPEFTCLCPLTGQPDFATIRIRYVPDQWLVELKSLKLYTWAYRDEGAFHEDVTNRILNDLVDVLAPRRMEVVGDWNVRGGIKTVVTVRYAKA
jgi:7-cyano-7-deazaguanine reductase